MTEYPLDTGPLIVGTIPDDELDALVAATTAEQVQAADNELWDGVIDPHWITATLAVAIRSETADARPGVSTGPDRRLIVRRSIRLAEADMLDWYPAVAVGISGRELVSTKTVDAAEMYGGKAVVSVYR